MSAAPPKWRAAPHDGVWMMGRIQQKRGNWRWFLARYEQADLDAVENANLDYTPEPTHWIPLPEKKRRKRKGGQP